MKLEKEFVTTLIGSACVGCTKTRNCQCFQNSCYLPIKCEEKVSCENCELRPQCIDHQDYVGGCYLDNPNDERYSTPCDEEIAKILNYGF